MKKRNVPWWVWVTVAAAAFVVVSMFTTEKLAEVYVVGAGAIGEIRPVDAPDGVKFRVRIEKAEPIARTAARIEKVLSLWPQSIVVAFDTSELAPENGGLTNAQDVVRELADKAAHTTSRIYFIGFVPGADASPEAAAAASVMNAWWRTEICSDARVRCVEPPRFSIDREEARTRMRDAIARALAGETLVPVEVKMRPNT